MSAIWQEVEEFIEKKKEEYKNDELAKKYPGSLAYAIQKNFDTIPRKVLSQGDIKSFLIKIAPDEPKIMNIDYELAGVDTKKLGKALAFMGKLGYSPRGFKEGFSKGVCFSTEEGNCIIIDNISFWIEAPYYKDKLYLRVFDKESAKDIERVAESIGVKVRD